jgi:hypothetical protein
LSSNPGIVKPCESPGKAGGLPRDYYPSVNRFEFAALLLGALKKLWGNPDRARELKSGDPAGMEKAISDILNVPEVYNDISNSLNSPPEKRLINLLLPLLKHEEYHVRCCIPGIFEVIGDASCIPHLEDVIKHDSESQVVKNARIAIDKINRLGVSTDTVKFLHRYTKPIDPTTTGTYEEYSAPNKNVARAFLERMPSVTQACFYIEIITPEGNIGKDNMGTF